MTQVDKEENGNKWTHEDWTSHKISYTMLQLMGAGGGGLPEFYKVWKHSLLGFHQLPVSSPLLDPQSLSTRSQCSSSKLGVLHPVVCTCNSILYLTVFTPHCGAMFLLCNCQLSDMFRPYRAIIRLYKTMVIRQGTCGSSTCGIPWFTVQYILKFYHILYFSSIYTIMLSHFIFQYILNCEPRDPAGNTTASTKSKYHYFM